MSGRREKKKRGPVVLRSTRAAERLALSSRPPASITSTGFILFSGLEEFHLYKNNWLVCVLSVVCTEVKRKQKKSQVAVVTPLIHFSRPLDGFLFRILGPTVKNNKRTRYHIEYSLGAFWWPSTFPCYLHFNEHPPKKERLETQKNNRIIQMFFYLSLGIKKEPTAGRNTIERWKAWFQIVKHYSRK